MRFAAFAFSSLLLAMSALAQFFNASALALTLLVGQKKACSKAFPELVQPLQAAYEEFARRNSAVLPVEKFKEIDSVNTLAESAVFAKLTRDQCEGLIRSMPTVSLQALIEEQTRLNEERRKDEQQ
jgi:hypothetical protein